MIWEYRKRLWILIEWKTGIECFDDFLTEIKNRGIKCFGDFVTEIILEQGQVDLTIGRSKESEFQVEEAPQISTVIIKGIHCLTIHCHVHVN